MVGKQESTNSIIDIAKGAGMMLTGKVSGKAVLFLYTIYLAYSLPTEEVGLYFLGLTIILFANVLSNLGLKVGVTRYVSIYSAQSQWVDLKNIIFESALITIITSLLLILILFGFSEFLSVVIFKNRELIVAIRILSCSILPTSLMWNFLSATRGLKLMQYSAIIEEFSLVVLRFAFAFVFVSILGFGFKGILWAFVFSSWICMFLSLYCVMKHLPKEFKGRWAHGSAIELLKFSVPMLMSQFIGNITRQIDIIMIGFFLSASSVAIYSVTVRLILLAEITFRVFTQIFNPYISEIHANERIDQLSHLLKLITKWNLIISYPIFISAITFPSLFLGFFGEEFVAGSLCLIILSATHLLSSFSDLPASVIYMSGRSDITLKNNISTLIFNIILNFILIPRMGIAGAAVSTGTTLVFLSFLRLFELHKLHRIHPFSKGLLIPVLSGFLLISLPLFFLKIKFPSYSNFDGKIDFTVFYLSLFYIAYLIAILLVGLNQDEIEIKNRIKNKIFRLKL